jgi:hypothetical protein
VAKSGDYTKFTWSSFPAPLPLAERRRSNRAVVALLDYTTVNQRPAKASVVPHAIYSRHGTQTPSRTRDKFQMMRIPFCHTAVPQVLQNRRPGRCVPWGKSIVDVNRRLHQLRAFPLPPARTPSRRTPSRAITHELTLFSRTLRGGPVFPGSSVTQLRG